MHSFADIIIPCAIDMQADTIDEESAKRLAARSFQAYIDRTIGQAFVTVIFGDFT